MIAVASRSLNNNRSRGSSSSYSAPRQKTAEEIAAEEERNLAYQKKQAEQTNLFNECQEKAALSPPEYPIQIIFNNNYFRTILRNNEHLVFASSFNDAVKKVEANIGSMDSDLMNEFKNSNYYKEGDVLRLSSANKSMFRNVNLNLPEGRYSFMYSVSKTAIPCWNVIISSAKPTMLSSFRIASQNKSTTGGKTRTKKSTHRKSTFKKSAFKKGRAKKSRKTTRRKG